MTGEDLIDFKQEFKEVYKLELRPLSQKIIRKAKDIQQAVVGELLQTREEKENSFEEFEEYEKSDL